MGEFPGRSDSSYNSSASIKAVGSHKSERESASVHPPRILIADDDSSIRDICSVIAQSAGYAVSQAES